MRLATIGDIAAAVRGRRAELGISQDDLARRAGVSRKWVVEFEAGKPKAEMALILRALDALGLAIDVTVPGPGSDPNATDLGPDRRPPPWMTGSRS